MKRMSTAGAIVALLLTGCQAPGNTPRPESRNYGAASDVAVTRHTQYRLWDRGTFSAQPPHPVTAVMTANSDRLSLDWEGDAVELLNELARLRGLQFNYSGVRLPLPVTLHVRDMTFNSTLRLLEAQTAWRATIRQLPGLLQLTFMEPESRKK